MKKNLLSIFGIAFSLSAFAQLPVSTTAENKNVVLEEFTGIYCVFCPDGHKRAKEISDNNPGDVVLINVHTGGYANPNGSDPDFRTSFGSALAGQTGLTGYPSGTVNRRVWSGSNTAQSRTAWAGSANTILGEASYANVALEGEIDYATRELTVDVEVHFTGTAPSTMNLNVALLQNNVAGPQTGGSNFNPSALLPNGDYNHQHMLRHLLTGQWGDEITTTTQGTTFAKQFTYSIPDDINDIPMVLTDLEIVAFVVEGQQNIITGAKGPINFTNLQGDNITLKGVDPSSSCDLMLQPVLDVKNNGGNEITSMRVRYHLGGQNVTYYDWTGSINAFENASVTLGDIAVPSDIGTSLTVEIINVNGVADNFPDDNMMTDIQIGVGSGLEFTFEFTQDRWGNESTWEIVEEGTTNVILSGGPYGVLGSNGTQVHSYDLVLPSVGCYSIKVNDSQGDGINSGKGEGMFAILDKDGNTTVLSNDGTFDSEVVVDFNVLSASPLSIGSDEVASELTVFPNPVTNIANIKFSLNNADNATLTIHNILGEVVYTETNLNQGQNIIDFDVTNLRAGMYFTTINAEEGISSTKFTVAK